MEARATTRARRDEEMEPAMGNTRTLRPERRRVRRAPVCKWWMCLAVAVLSGCAGSGDAPMRRAAELQSAAAAHPDSPEPSVRLALLHYEQGDADAALGQLRSALARDPAYEPALTLLARLLHESGRSEAGVRWFATRPLSAWPEAVRLDVALLLADTGRTEEARRILVELQEGAHRDAATANLAWVDLLEGKNADAATRLASLGADAPEVRNNLAVAKLRAGDVEGSEALLEKLADGESGFAPARLNLALLRRHYRFDTAGDRLEQESRAALAARSLSDAAVQALLVGAAVEDASPAPAVGEGGHGSR